MKITPLNEFVIIERVEEKKDDSPVYTTHKETKVGTGKVLAVSEEMNTGVMRIDGLEGPRSPLCKTNDIVLFFKEGVIPHESQFIVPYKNLIGKLEK